MVSPIEVLDSVAPGTRLTIQLEDTDGRRGRTMVIIDRAPDAIRAVPVTYPDAYVIRVEGGTADLYADESGEYCGTIVAAQPLDARHG